MNFNIPIDVNGIVENCNSKAEAEVFIKLIDKRVKEMNDLKETLFVNIQLGTLK